MALPRVLREANIKVYASVLMDNSVSLEEKAVALNELFQIFDYDTYHNEDVYAAYGLGVYYRNRDSGDVETSHVSVVSPS